MTGIDFATTALNQLGGKAFTFMTGAKDHMLINDHTLKMSIGRNATSANRFYIILDADDTYTMRLERQAFSKKTFDTTRTIVKEASGLYCDQIREVFERWTGMSTKVPQFV